ncbi:fimbrial protein [Salmonella enterica subsp. enterica]|uniref:Fimbrial protein n=1 Tax=Salmonella enterica I TaxID=59201 RepID=A0A379VYA6_SALET|nr:fimbrial protein [Salmonella enterica subsp. enterica]
MNTAVKAAVAAALVMGVSSFANAAGSNTGTVTFTGTIEDSPCSIVVGDEHQTVNLGHIGTGSLMGGKESSKVDFHIGLENCAFTTEKEASTVFSAIGNESSANPGSVALMRIGGGRNGGFQHCHRQPPGFRDQIGRRLQRKPDDEWQRCGGETDS